MLLTNDEQDRKECTHQLQKALVMYLLASSRWRRWDHPSPFVAFPPLNTVVFNEFISAPGPVALKVPLTLFILGCWGSWFSAIPSWPDGIRSNVDFPLFGTGRVPWLTLDGKARRAWRIMYWWGAQALGASLRISHCKYLIERPIWLHAYHWRPVSTKVDGYVPLKRFNTKFSEAKWPKAALSLRATSSGMMPLHNG